MRAARVATLGLVACAVRSAPGPGPGTDRPPAPAPAVVAPPAAPTLDAMLAPVRRDRRLDAVAARAAASAADGHVVSAAAVRDAMIAALATDVLPYVLTARGDDAAALAQLGPAFDELRAAAALDAVGVAVATGPAGRVVALVASPAPAVPTRVTRDGTRARVVVTWAEPAAVSAWAVLPDRSRRLATTVSADAIEAVLDCTVSPGATVELDAGPRLLASVVGACGAPAPIAADGVDIGPPARTRPELEQRLFELVVRERVQAGLAPLTWDADAHRLARAHAADMAAAGYVGHVSSTGATLTDRIARVRLPIAQAFENVGHASGPGEAHYAFLASPGHRANLLAAPARRGAVGIVVDPREPGAFYVTELLLEPGR